MTILELPSLHQSGAVESGRVISGSKKHDHQTPERHRALQKQSGNERALLGSNGSCWHETDLPRCPQFGRYRGKADIAVTRADFLVPLRIIPDAGAGSLPHNCQAGAVQTRTLVSSAIFLA